MLHIVKGQAPQQWVEAVQALRATPDATINYNGLRDKAAKEALLDALLVEQGYVCAYCTRRIRRKGDGRSKGSYAHIEHYLPQNPSDALRDSMPTGGSYDADELSLDYRNLLAVCSGGETGSHGEARICDKSRSKTKMLVVDPRSAQSVRLVDYKNDGTIYSEDKGVNEDLDEQLGLNLTAYSFKENRKRAMESVDFWAKKQPGNHVARRRACEKRKQKYLADRAAHGEAEPYLGAVLWRLEYWIRRWS